MTGASVGLAGSLPSVRSRAVKGAASPAEALRQLMAGSGYHAVQVGPLAWRIERDPLPAPATPPAPAPDHAPAAAAPAIAPTILVTAQKRRQDLAEIPMSLAVIDAPDGVGSRPIRSSADTAYEIEGLALTNLGPGRNRQFIRGVADSPFDGVSQATVAIQLDDARVIFDAPDPDLRLVDIDRIEVLKGPQGPLYGSGALGGIYHLVTRKPELDKLSGSVRLIAETVPEHGSGGGGEAVLNIPLERDRLALRAVVYSLWEPGWINRGTVKRDANNARDRGGRLALRWRPSSDWTIDVGAVVQHLDIADSQYVNRSDKTLTRTGSIAEPSDNNFHEGHATIEGGLGSLRLVSATSYVDQDVHYILDASAAANLFKLTAPLRFRDNRHYSILNQELRLSPENSGRWVAGASYMRAHSHGLAMIEDASGASHRVQLLDRTVTEYALFGEATVPLAPKLDATVGARLSRTITDDEAIQRRRRAEDRRSSTIFSPSAAVMWLPDPGNSVYLRYARAIRPGGLASAGRAQPMRFDSDELGTVDLGMRHDPPNGPLHLAASVYFTAWSHIQSDYLLPNGLVSTRNAGRGRILGGEAAADWRLAPRLRLLAGLSLQHSRLTHTEQNLELHDRRLPIAPNITARLGMRYDRRLGPAWSLGLAGQVNYIGKARLALDDALDRKMGDYAIAAASATLTRGPLTLTTSIDNLLNAKGDSFAFGNPFTIMAGRQFTPLRPRSITMSVAWSW